MVFRKYGKKALSLILTAAMLSAAAYPAAAEELSDGSLAGITDESQAYEDSYDGSYREEASFDNEEVFGGETDPADEEAWGGIPAAAAEGDLKGAVRLQDPDRLVVLAVDGEVVPILQRAIGGHGHLHLGGARLAPGAAA